MGGPGNGDTKYGSMCQLTALIHDPNMLLVQNKNPTDFVPDQVILVSSSLFLSCYLSRRYRSLKYK